MILHDVDTSDAIRSLTKLFSPCTGVIIRFSKPHTMPSVMEGLDRILSECSHSQAFNRFGVVYASGDYADGTISKIREYTSACKGVERVDFIDGTERDFDGSYWAMNRLEDPK